MKVMLARQWDGGIITEGVDRATPRMNQTERAFATAVGYVAHAICKSACIDSPK